MAECPVRNIPSPARKASMASITGMKASRFRRLGKRKKTSDAAISTVPDARLYTCLFMTILESLL